MKEPLTAAYTYLSTTQCSRSRRACHFAASHVPSIDASTAVGITFSITFIMAFSVGVLVSSSVQPTVIYTLISESHELCRIRLVCCLLVNNQSITKH